MIKYRVLVNGKNFDIRVQGAGLHKNSRIGFYVNVFVDATNTEDAELAAVDFLRNDEWLKTSTRNPKTDPPLLQVVEINRVKSFKGYSRKRHSAFAFYTERSKSRAKKKS